MDENNLQDKIKELQTSYYNENKKNSIFKKRQKYDCAQTVTTNLDILELLKNTIFSISGSNHIFFHYPTFKTFAYPEIFGTVVNFFIDLCFDIFKSHNCIYLHINWQGYTVSSHQRYTGLYDLFIAIGKKRQFDLEQVLERLILYNPPNMLEQISTLIKPIIAPGILEKIDIISKNDSDFKIKQLFDSLK